MENEDDLNVKSDIFCILSTKVMIDKEQRPQCEMIIINKKTGKIFDIKKLGNENDDNYSKIVKMYKTEYKVLDVGDLYILPGVIDSCCYLNSDYHETWRSVREASKTSAASGITTLVDHPMMRLDAKDPEVLYLKRRIRQLRNYKKYTDVALMAHLGNLTKTEMQNILDEGAIGFSGYLMPIFEPKLKWLDQKNLENVFKNLNSLDRKMTVSIYCDYGTGRELAVSSPYRTKPLESRLKKGVNIDLKLTKDAYADGEVDSELKMNLDREASDCSGSDSLDEDFNNSGDYRRSLGNRAVRGVRSGIIGEGECSDCSDNEMKNSTSIEPEALDSRSLKISAIHSSKLATLRNLSNLEIMSYTSCDSPNSNFNFEEDLEDIESPKFPLLPDEFDQGSFEIENTSPLIESPNHFHLNARNSRSRSSHELDVLGLQSVKKKTEETKVTEVRPSSQREQSFSSEKRANFSDSKRNRQGVKLEAGLAPKGKNTPKAQKVPDDKVLELERPSLFKINLQSAKTSSLLARRKNFKPLLRIATTKTVLNPKKEVDKYRHKYSFFQGNRPVIWQKKALNSLIRALKSLKKKPNFKTMLTNITSASLISHIRDYNKLSNSKRIAVNVLTPHMFFTESKIRDRMTDIKCGQPIRDSKNKRHLINHHQIKSITCVSSGHMYVPPVFKNIDNGCFIKSFNGFCSSGFLLQSVWTSLVLLRIKMLMKYTKRRFYFSESEIRALFKDFEKEIFKLVRVTSRKPAEILNLEQKGRIEIGKDADLVIWDPFKSRSNKIDLNLQDTHIYKKSQFLGCVEMTFLRGNCVFSRKYREDFNAKPIGEIILQKK